MAGILREDEKMSMLLYALRTCVNLNALKAYDEKIGFRTLAVAPFEIIFYRLEHMHQ
mgnify:CR=1